MESTQENIRRLRRLGLSQTRIAELTDIPQPRISRWESGDVPGSVDDALRLSRLVEEIERQSDVPLAKKASTRSDRKAA